MTENMMTSTPIKPKKKRRSITKCNLITKDGRICTGKYRLEYDLGAPIFICDSCGDKDITWKKFYTEYLHLWKNKDSWEDKKNSVSCILGFFCHMYKEFFKIDYIFVPSNPNPYGAKEVKDSWTLLATFDNNIHDVRRYIYWVFKKGINKNCSIANFGYINSPGLIRRYKLQAEKNKTPTRDSNLPAVFLDWCRVNANEVFNNYALSTMNDLGALVAYVNEYRGEFCNSNVEILVVNKATEYGLIVDGKLNVRG